MKEENKIVSKKTFVERIIENITTQSFTVTCLITGIVGILFLLGIFLSLPILFCLGLILFFVIVFILLLLINKERISLEEMK